MNVGVLALIVGVVALTYVIVASRREKVERTYERGENYRKLITAAAAVIVAWTFIRSGDPVLIAFAVLGFVFATVYVMIEQPQKQVV